MRSIPFLFAVVLCASLHSSPSLAQSESKAEVVAPTAAELAEKVDVIAAEQLRGPGAAGLSIAVARGGVVVLEKGYGLADVEFDAPANERTLFRIGSVTKQFSAAIAMKMVERGELSLDDDLAKFELEFPLQGRHVTVRHLLNHTSGIPSYTDQGEEWTPKWPLELTDAELLALVADKPFVFEPGASWAYNNTGYYLLGMVLEKVSGKSYEQLVLDEICKPLGLQRTRYDSNVELIKNRAQGYTLRDGELVNDQFLGMSQPGAAGGLISTAGELVRWMAALNSGKVVSPESFAQMTTPAPAADGKGAQYGFGLARGDLDGRARIEHGGGIFGFNSMLAWYPDSDLVVAVISNGEPISSARIADTIALAALGVERAPLLDLALEDDLAKRLAGDYRIELLGLDVAITARDGKLFLQATGQQSFPLLHQGELRFRAAFDDTLTVEFKPDGGAFTLRQRGGIFEAARKP